MPEITPRTTARRLRGAGFALALSAGTIAGVGAVATVTAETAQAAEATYTVQAGDGWWIISTRTGVSMSALQSLNGMSSATMLHPGMVLKTDGAAAESSPVTSGSYTVRAGDGWWAISDRTNVSMSRLQSLNGMTSATMLHPGMVLKTTGSSSTPAPAPAPAPTPVVRQSSSDNQDAVDFMLSKVRDSSTYYLWGGTGPYGYDCSGLVQDAMAAAGKNVARLATDQYRNAPTRVSISQAQPGDLVFWINQSTGRMYHVAMYIGDGKVAHALNPTDDLTITSIDVMTSNRAALVARY